MTQNNNGSYWKGTVDEKLDQLLDYAREAKEERRDIKIRLYQEVSERKDACIATDIKIAKVDKKVAKIIAVGSLLMFLISTGIAVAAIIF